MNTPFCYISPLITEIYMIINDSFMIIIQNNDVLIWAMLWQCTNLSSAVVMFCFEPCCHDVLLWAMLMWCFALSHNVVIYCFELCCGDVLLWDICGCGPIWTILWHCAFMSVCLYDPYCDGVPIVEFCLFRSFYDVANWLFKTLRSNANKLLFIKH